MTQAELRERWMDRRDEYQRAGAQVDGVKIVDIILADLQAMEEDQGDQLLSLRQAAQLSGYPKDSLSRMIREAKIPNSGRKGKPLIRRRDLPLKPGRVLAGVSSRTYAPDADARALLARLGER